MHNKVIVFSIHRKCSITGVVYDTPSKINSISLLENVISLPFASPRWQSARRSLFLLMFSGFVLMQTQTLHLIKTPGQLSLVPLSACANTTPAEESQMMQKT